MTEKYKVKPEQAKSLEELEKIVGVSIPQVKKIEFDTFGVKIESDNVVGIGLDGRRLTTLPESISNLTSLQELWLRNNKFTALPESVTKLMSLQRLDLFNNQLTTLPESITKLTSLQILSLATNQLTTLPESIGNLTSLQLLNLDINKLTTLPESIGNLKSLTFLNLNHNQLTTLPESIGNLISLETLNLEENQLTTLPESIGNLKSLQKLYLRNNKFTTLPESFSQLKNLEDINLKYNNWKGEWQEMTTNHVPTILNLCRKLRGIDIFISHAMIDQADYPIIELKQHLGKSDLIHDVHLCEEDLRDSIQAFMDNNVPRSQLLLFIATENSLASKDCLYELSLARKFGVKILLIKGNDIDREDLKQVDLRPHEKDSIDLSTLEGFEFKSEIFDRLHEYITEHQSELKLLKKKQEKLNNAKSTIQKNIMDFADSNEFKEHLKENFEEFQKISQEVNNNRITDLEYILKLSEILNRKVEN